SKVLQDPDLELRSRAAALVDRIDPSHFLAARIAAQRGGNLTLYPESQVPEDIRRPIDGVDFGFERRRWINGGKTLGTLLRSSAATHFDGELSWSVGSGRSHPEEACDTCSGARPAGV